MSSTTAQRRGKPAPKPEPTILVKASDGTLHRQPTQQQEQALKIATVRRKLCGTGPFDKHWLNVDCCGLFCALLTYFLHGFGVYAVCFVLIPPWMSYYPSLVNAEATEQHVLTPALLEERTLTVWGQIHRALFIFIAGMAVISHYKAMTTDPGAIPPDAKPLLSPEEAIEDAGVDGRNQPPETSSGGSMETQKLVAPKPQRHVRLCRRCKAFKPQRAHHCSVCKRCINRMDHHCPWVNNCVGLGNHKYFLLFVFYTFLSCSYSMILTIARFATCVGNSHGRHSAGSASFGANHHTPCMDQPADLLRILGLLIESLLFGMFTSCMMFDQFDVIRTKLTHIDRLKGMDAYGSLSGPEEVFGTGPRGGVKGGSAGRGFRMDWLSPFAEVCYPDSLRDEVRGFCLPAKTLVEEPSDLELPPASVGSATRSPKLRSVAEIV